MKKDDKKSVNSAIIVPIIGLVAFSLIMFNIAPNFFPYLAGVIIITIVIYAGLRVVHQITGRKCPHCGRALQDVGYQVVFKGALSMDGEHRFPPIVVRYYQCPNCEDVQYQRFDDAVPVQGSGHLDAINRHIDTVFLEKIYNQEMPQGTGFAKSPRMTDQEYQRLKENIEKMVRTNNMRAGFSK